MVRELALARDRAEKCTTAGLHPLKAEREDAMRLAEAIQAVKDGLCFAANVAMTRRGRTL